MLVIQESRTIFDERQKNKILAMVSDEYCRKILSVIMKEYKSANKISKETKIPISTVYRRIQVLHDGKLIKISGTISDDGKKTFTYKSKITTISTFFNGDFIDIEIVPNVVEELQVR